MRQNTGDEINNLVSTTRTLKDSLETLVGRMNSLGESFGSETTASSVRLTGAVEQFSASFLPVQQKLEGFASCITALESVAARIEQAGGNLSGAADLTHESNSKLAGTVSDIASNLAPLQTALTDLSIAFQQIARTSDDLRVAGQTISTAAHNLQSSSESISSAEERFHRKAELLESAATGISSAITGLERSSANVTAASDPLGALTERMHLAVEQMRETEARIVRGHEHLDSIVRELKNYAETVPSVWQSYETRFKGVDADMSAAFGQLAAQSGQFQSSVETFVKALDDSFSRSLQSLSGAIQELADEREQAAEVKIPAGRNP
jgi:chromosome segregation ATPase